MRGGDDLAVAHKGEGGVELAGSEGVLVEVYLVLKVKVLDKLLLLVIVFVKTGVKRQIALAAGGEEHASLRRDRHIPHGVVLWVLGGEDMSHAGLGNKLKKFLRLITHYLILIFHFYILPSRVVNYYHYYLKSHAFCLGENHVNIVFFNDFLKTSMKIQRFVVKY